jgi:phage pi2 protein 07
MEEDNILEVVQRWEATGLLDGLPLWEKEELSQLYDNITRLLLSKKAIEKIPETTHNMMGDVMFPITRRLYRRVGVNFDTTSMISELLTNVEKNKIELLKEVTPESNPIVDFCREFADNYEDDVTVKKSLSKEDYIKRVDTIMDFTKKILLSDKMVSHVDRENGGWEIYYSDKKKSENYTRLWNQKIASDLLITVLSDTNKGF